MSELKVSENITYTLSGLLYVELEVIGIALDEIDNISNNDPVLGAARERVMKVIAEVM